MINKVTLYYILILVACKDLLYSRMVSIHRFCHCPLEAFNMRIDLISGYKCPYPISSISAGAMEVKLLILGTWKSETRVFNVQQFCRVLW